MTSFMKARLSCSCCGRDCEQQVLASTNSFGSHDLDQRPPEMKRHTMSHWLHECPSCGFVGPELKGGDRSEAAFVASSVYQSVRGDESFNATQRRFLLGAMLAARSEKYERAFQNTLSAAWEADDRRNADMARSLRLKASGYLRDRELSNATVKLVLLDALRRAEEWQAAQELLERLKQETLEHPLPIIVQFQDSKVQAKDSASYTVANAFDTA